MEMQVANNMKIFKRTGRRAMNGVFALTEDKTSIDPTGILMHKQHSRIQNVNKSDFERMCSNFNMSQDEGIAHIECVSSIPFSDLKFKTEIVENKRHPMPELFKDEGITIPVPKAMPKILLFPNNWSSSWEKVLKGENVPPTYWTKDVREYESPRAINYPKIENKKKYVMAPYSELDTYEKVLKDFIIFLNNNKDEEIVHLWTQGTLVDGNDQYGPLAIANRLYNDVLLRNHNIEFKKSEALIKEYWTRDVFDTDDHYLKSATLSHPRRINVVGWRVCNYGMRDYKQSYPQAVPSTRLSKMLNIDKTDLMKKIMPEYYLNYSGHVRMRKITNKEIEDLDFAYHLHENGLFLATKPTRECYVVDNTQMFSGFGSLCTSMHSAYGIGRDVRSLMNEYKRRMITKEGTSGHMIASSLMYRCHLLIYLEEVLNNDMYGKSIYNLPVVEPTSGLYHTKQEYRNAVIDIQNLIRDGKMNKFAESNLHVISKFVEKLM